MFIMYIGTYFLKNKIKLVDYHIIFARVHIDLASRQPAHASLAKSQCWQLYHYGPQMQLFFRASQMLLSWHAEMWAHDAPPLYEPIARQKRRPKVPKPACLLLWFRYIGTYIVPNWTQVPQPKSRLSGSTAQVSGLFFLSFFWFF